jgi:hypothetical protein
MLASAVSMSAGHCTELVLRHGRPISLIAAELAVVLALSDFRHTTCAIPDPVGSPPHIEVPAPPQLPTPEIARVVTSDTLERSCQASNYGRRRETPNEGEG